MIRSKKTDDSESFHEEIAMWRRRFLGAQDSETFRKGVKETFLALTSAEINEHGPEKAIDTIQTMWKGW